MSEKRHFLVIAAGAAVLPVAFLATVFTLGVKFDRECEGRLKRAADANTAEVARRELGAALAYLERAGMTEGYTSVVYRTPDEDIGFWYSNLKAAQGELEAVGESATKLEKSNVLMKLRETILDQDGQGKTVVTTPSGIAVYPHNLAFGAWAAFAAASGLLCLGAIGCLTAK